MSEIKIKRATSFAGHAEENIEAKPAHVSAKNFSVFYGDFEAVKKVNCEFQEGRVTAMIGPSGCGKSTLLRAINRIFIAEIFFFIINWKINALLS